MSDAPEEVRKPARPVTFEGVSYPSVGAFARFYRGHEAGRLTKRQRNRALDALRENAKKGGT